jgi:hypothetical protein
MVEGALPETEQASMSSGTEADVVFRRTSLRAKRLLLAAHFSRHHGLISRSEATQLGLSRSAVGRRIASGEWKRVHPEVYRLVAAPESRAQRALAACLWAGEGSVVSHRAALSLWGFVAEVDGEEVTTPHRRDSRPDVRVHRARWLSPKDITTKDGVPVTTPERMAVDLAGLLDDSSLSDVLEFLLREELVTLKSLLKQVTAVRVRWVRGRARLRKHVLARLRRGGKGGALADATDALLLRGGLDVPARNHPFVDAQGERARIPLAFPALKVAILPFDTRVPQAERFENSGLKEALEDAGWAVRNLQFDRLAVRFTCLAEWIALAVTQASPTPTPPKVSWWTMLIQSRAPLPDAPA